MASYSGNATLSYSINSKHFTIDKQTGNVYLISKFRKNQSKYLNTHKFQVTASDGKASLSATNTIAIIDVNEDAPNFVSQERVFQINEVNNSIKVSLHLKLTKIIRIQAILLI